MRSWPFAFLALGAGAALAADGAGSGAPTAPSPGEAAPPFALAGSDGAIHRLSDHLGARAVVLAWFPKAFTGG